MALTMTTVVPRTAVGERQSIAIYALAWDSSYPTGGETVTLSDFAYVDAIEFGGNDTLDDNGYAVRPVLTYTTATSSAYPTLSVWYNYDPAGAGSSDRVDVEFTNTGDLSAIGQTMIVVHGR